LGGTLCKIGSPLLSFLLCSLCTPLQVNLLNQLKLAKRVNLFDYSLEELQAVHEYWRSMNRYSKQVLNKEKVA
jgi:hypothetical protein